MDGPLDLDTWAADVMTVFDAAEVSEAFVLGSGYGGLVAMRIAAHHPERVKGLVLAQSYARVTRTDDYPVGVPAAIIEHQATVIGEAETADGADIELMAPSLAGEADTRSWWARASTRAAGPTFARKMWELFTTCDERDTVRNVPVETLVIQTAENRFMRKGNAEWLAENLPRARLALLPGRDHVLWAHPHGDLLAEIEEFVTGERSHGTGQRQIVAILFTDLVGSTEGNARVGDAEWANFLARHDAICTGAIRRFGGRIVKTMGDGVLATFINVSSGVAAASAIAVQGRLSGFEIRIGLHAAEVELRANDVFGMGVNIASRTLAHAAPNEVTVTRTVVDLLAGSALAFDQRGSVEFKGVPGKWDLYALC